MAENAVIGEIPMSGASSGETENDDLLTAIREMQGETEQLQAQTRIILEGIDRKLDDIQSLLHGSAKAL